MKALIIEDENLAARRLESMIKSYDPAIIILDMLESVEESVEWFKTNSQPDLIFLDIHLEDGLSFSIFDKVKVTAPIIFTTAFDEYAIKAFKLKSIDYLLKPVVQNDLNTAIDKYKTWGNTQQSGVDMTELYQYLVGQQRTYRERFSVMVGQKLKTIEVKDISYFFSNSGITFAMLKTGNQYSLDQSLDALLQEIDPSKFFRINRQYLVSLQAIAHVYVFPKSKLQLELNPGTQDEIFVSLDKVTDFKKWFDGK